MATLVNTEFTESFFHCSICTDRYVEPKVLPCQHTFCKKCLDSYVQQEVSKSQNKNGFLCPYCRSFTNVKSSLPPNKWVESLVTNFNLMNMMEALDQQKHNDNGQCEIHSKILEYCCKNHRQDICSDCAVFEHKYCDIMSAGAVKAHEKALSEISKKCSTLKQIDERISEKMDKLTERKSSAQQILKLHFNEMRERLNAAEMDQLNLLEDKFCMEQSNLAEEQQSCRNILGKSESFLEELKTQEETFDIGKVEKGSKPIQAELDSCIENMNKHQEVIFISKSDTDMQRRLEQFSELIGEVLVNISTGGDLSPEERTSPDQTFHASAPPRHKPSGSGDEPPPTYSTVMQCDPLSAGGIASLPNVSAAAATQAIGYASLNGPPHPSLCYPYPVGLAPYPLQEPLVYPHPNVVPTATPGMSTSGEPRALQLATSFNAKRPNDKTHCWITGAAILSNDNIVLADRNNKKVKLFSNTFYCIVDMAMQTYPFDVTETCTGEIAVTFPKQNRVNFFHLETLTPCSHYIDTEQSCLGITSGHERLYVCCDTTWSKVGCIRIYDKYNQQLIKIEKDDRGKDMVSVTDYLAVCPISGNMFFKRGGFSKECLHCTTNQGTVLWKAKVPSWMDVPSGLCVLNDGVIVSMGSLKWVCPGGHKWVKLLDSSEIEGPCALAMSHDKTRLVVTQADAISNCKENDVVKIFTIVYPFG